MQSAQKPNGKKGTESTKSSKEKSTKNHIQRNRKWQASKSNQGGAAPQPPPRNESATRPHAPSSHAATEGRQVTRDRRNVGHVRVANEGRKRYTKSGQVTDFYCATPACRHTGPLADLALASLARLAGLVRLATIVLFAAIVSLPAIASLDALARLAALVRLAAAPVGVRQSASLAHRRAVTPQSLSASQ